jgi:hypothetical protein
MSIKEQRTQYVSYFLPLLLFLLFRRRNNIPDSTTTHQQEISNLFFISLNSNFTDVELNSWTDLRASYLPLYLSTPTSI